MRITLDSRKTEELMKAFYTVAGIRFVLFDANHREIAAYPAESCAFCTAMKSCPRTRRRCVGADKRALKKCSESGSVVVYNCHAGLVEAAVPIFDNEQIVAYLMFGRVRDRAHDKTRKLLPEVAALCGMPQAELQTLLDRTETKGMEQITSAAKIMEACANYIVFKEMITPQNDRIFLAAKEYIAAHLQENIDISSLCEELQISRSRLYTIFRQEADQGIAEYIKRQRMHRAKKLLKTTDLPIPEIAAEVGFLDYNYFSRVYKSVYGKSPKTYRRATR